MSEFPIETGFDAPADRDDFLTYLDPLVAWTKDRLFPEWEEESLRRRRFVCRGVLDAPSVSDDTLAILRHLTQRMLHEQVFERGSHRAGELSGTDLPSAASCSCLVPKADGAARFANGDWSGLARVIPVVDEVMSVGWATYAMDTYLPLCELADAAFPIGAFTRRATASIDAQDEASQAWFESAIPARIAGVVQRLADAHYPLPHADAQDLLGILDRLVDMGDRRAAALQQSEAFRGIQLTR